jgi:hypothetical protein
VEQRRLTRATLAHNRQHLTFAYPERQIVKEHKVRGSRTIDLAESLDPEDLFLLHWMHSAFSLVQIRATTVVEYAAR